MDENKPVNTVHPIKPAPAWGVGFVCAFHYIQKNNEILQGFAVKSMLVICLKSCKTLKKQSFPGINRKNGRVHHIVGLSNRYVFQIAIHPVERNIAYPRFGILIRPDGTMKPFIIQRAAERGWPDDLRVNSSLMNLHARNID